MLSPDQLEPLACMFGVIFRFLPGDVVRLIAEQVHAQADSISLQRFYKGSSAGICNYATARLLRISWILRQNMYTKGNTPTIREYKDMSIEQRRLAYPLLKRIVRQRHQLFAREVCRKRTRSGLGY